MEPTEPITVLFLIDELDQWRGTETHLFRLLRHLDPGRIRPVVAVVGAAGLAPDFLEAGIPAFGLEINRVFAPSGVRGVGLIRALIRREGVRLVVSYHTASDLLAPVAARLSGVATLSNRRDVGFTKKQIHLRIQRPLNRLVAGMIAVSHGVAGEVSRLEGYARDRIQVIWNGEDLEKFKPGPSPVRSQLDLDEQTVVITCVSGLDPVKDHRTLLAAYQQVAERRPKNCLLLVGRGAERDRLAALSRPLGDRVRFLGHRADVADILRASDIYAQTSLTEGFSNAILQAMACGLPVVATRVGGNPELVGAECGFLTEPRQVGQVVDGLERLLDDEELRRRMGRAARHWAEAHGALAAVAECYMDAFERAVVGRFPGPSDGLPGQTESEPEALAKV